MVAMKNRKILWVVCFGDIICFPFCIASYIESERIEDAVALYLGFHLMTFKVGAYIKLRSK
jgi:hypothetical protein